MFIVVANYRIYVNYVFKRLFYDDRDVGLPSHPAIGSSVCFLVVYSASLFGRADSVY